MSEEKNHYNLEDAQGLICDVLIPASEELEFNFRDWRESVLGGLYTSALELGWSILLLINKDLGYHSYPLGRGLLISIIEIKNILENDEYIRNAQFEFEKSTLDKLKISKEGNPYLNKISEMPNLDALIEEHQTICDDLYLSGARKIPDEQKFRRAGEGYLYDGVYRELSRHAHNGISALIARHARFEMGEDDYQMQGFDHGDESNFQAMTTTVYEALLDASILVHNEKSTSSLERLRELSAS